VGTDASPFALPFGLSISLGTPKGADRGSGFNDQGLRRGRRPRPRYFGHAVQPLTHLHTQVDYVCRSLARIGVVQAYEIRKWFTLVEEIEHDGDWDCRLGTAFPRVGSPSALLPTSS
jgi:hypothetical protein